MSTWATRCNACGTAFRVHEDQLQVSDGYVRCGRCDAVFNARSTLFDLDAPAEAVGTPNHTSVAAAQVVAPSNLASRADPDESTPLNAVSSGDGDDDGSNAAGHEAFNAEPRVVTSDASSDGPTFHLDGAAADPTWAEPVVSESTRTDRTEPSWSPPLPSGVDDPGDNPTAHARPTPDDPNARMLALLQESPVCDERPVDAPPAAAQGVAARSRPTSSDWPSLHRPTKRRLERRWRWAGGTLAAGLLLALPLHWAWLERDALRARWPALDLALTTHWPSLSTSGWQHLDGLTVMSSALKATPQGGAYQLDVSLHNGSSYRLAMPWFDISLVDAKGQAVVRKALSPETVGATKPLGAGEQRRLTTIFRIEGSSGPVAGYELGLFHP